METWEVLTMSRKEVARPGLMKGLVARQQTNRHVATVRQVSLRHAPRLAHGRAPRGCSGRAAVDAPWLADDANIAFSEAIRRRASSDRGGRRCEAAMYILAR